MSLLKWTLAAAGTAMGMRYLSDRHRRRLADGGSRHAQTDRDDGRSNETPWSDTQGSDDAVGGLGTGAGMGPSTGVGTSLGGSSGSRFEQDDLLAPDRNDPTPGSSSNRS